MTAFLPTSIPGVLIDPWTSSLVKGDKSAHLTKNELLLVQKLLEGWASYEALSSIFVPAAKLQTVRVVISRLRMKLAPLSLYINNVANGYNLKEFKVAHSNP